MSSVRQLLLGGSQQWRNTQGAIRDFIAANYDQPNPHNQAAMASPPTITQGDFRATLSVAYRYANGSVYPRYYGGSDLFFGSLYRRFPTATISTSGGNTANGQQAIAWRATAICTSQQVGLFVLGTTAAYRFISDNQYVDTTGTVPTTSSGANWIALDFGSTATRTVTVEGEQDAGFGGFYLAPSGTIASVGTAKRMIVVGDSFEEATGATRRGDGLGMVAGDILGFADTWQSGAGGTGYVVRGGFSYNNLSQRLGDVNTTGPWDVIVVAMGINDIGQSVSRITAEANFCLRRIRLFNPAAQMFVVGPWDVNAPAAPVANYAATKAAIQAGIPAGMGITFLDPEGVEYTKSDTTHPDTDGHATLGAWLALQIKTALGA